jgi:hypothetical protein
MKQNGKIRINGWGIAGLLMGAIIVLIVLAVVQDNLDVKQPETVLGILMAQVIVALMLLFIMATGFALLGLADPQQALGLPEGSIRAMIALFLIMIFVTFGLYLFRAIASGTATNQDAVDVAKQLITTVGTLVVAVAGFYFGSRAVQVARGVATPDEPKINSVDEDKKAEPVTLEIKGEGFLTVNTVKLLSDKPEIIAQDVVSNDSRIVAKFKTSDFVLDKEGIVEKEKTYAVVVVNKDGAEARRDGAFTMKPVNQQTTPPAQPPSTPPVQPPVTPPAQPPATPPAQPPEAPPVKPPVTPQA